MKKCQPLVVLILVLASGTAVGQEAADVDVARLDPDRPTVLITGSNRGIGLGFAAGYAAEGWNVIATARNPDDALELAELADQFDSVFIEELDVTDQRELDSLSAKYSGTPIDVLINNAAFHGGAPEDHWLGSYNYEVFETYMQVNVFGPLAVTEAFFESVALSNQKKIVTLTSGGRFSVAQNRAPGRGASFQSISKTAVNMAMTTLRNEVKDQGVIVALIAPRFVLTDGASAMGEIRQAAAEREEERATESNSGSGPPNWLPVEESVAAMMEVIEALDESHDGSRLDHRGNVVPW